MKRKLIYIFILLAVIFTLSSCQLEETIIKPSTGLSGTTTSTNTSTGTTTGTNDSGNDTDDSVFTVALMYDGYLFELDKNDSLKIEFVYDTEEKVLSGDFSEYNNMIRQATFNAPKDYSSTKLNVSGQTWYGSASNGEIKAQFIDGSKGILNDTHEFTYSIKNNKLTFNLKRIITVIWSNDFEHYEAQVDETGIAMITGLDGTYDVRLSATPEDYTYNPNIYSANNDSPNVEIELIRISTTRNGTGRALYNEFEITKVGTFRAKIIEKFPVVYYEFQPEGSGYFSIESMVDITNGDINPKVEIYDGSFAYKTSREIKNDGGVSGSYTKNFKWVVNLADEMIGNVYTFAISADTRTGLYPIYVDFTIRYLEDYEIEHSSSTLVDAKELEYARIDDIDDYSKYTYTNANGGVGDYENTGVRGAPLLDGSQFGYNEETKLWHHLNEDGSFGEKLCVEITTLTPFLNEVFTGIEAHGNKALTVFGLNHKAFIEQQYAGIVNSDGAVYVTMEMKNFLQMYAVNQSLFFDGNGYIEVYFGVTAAEEDQWLFAVGYYKLNE